MLKSNKAVAKAVAVSVVAVGVALGTATPALASTATMPIQVGAHKDAKLNYSKTIKVYTDSWSTFVTDNNFFDANVTFSNNSGNPGSIQYRITNGSGAVIKAPTTVSVGSSSTSNVSAFSGTYTLEVKAVSTAGDYNLTAHD